MDNKKLEIILAAKNTTQKVFSGFTGSLTAMKNQIFSVHGAIGLLAGGAGIYALTKSVGSWMQAADKQQKSTAGLIQVMQSMGRYTPELEANLLGVAKSLQQVTAFGDEATIEGQKFLLTYKGITDELLPRTSAAMLDLAALMGGGPAGVTRAANMLGKASMGMTGELRRVGISVDEATYKSKGFVGVLAQIESQVHGQAQALAQVGLGPWEQFSNIMGDVKEHLGDMALTFVNNLNPALKTGASELETALADLKENGQLDIWARDMAIGFLGATQTMVGGVQSLTEALFALRWVMSEVGEKYHSMTAGLKELTGGSWGKAAASMLLTHSLPPIRPDIFAKSGEVARGQIGGDVSYYSKELADSIRASESAAHMWGDVSKETAEKFDKINDRFQALIDALGRMKSATASAKPGGGAGGGEVKTGGTSIDYQQWSTEYASEYDAMQKLYKEALDAYEQANKTVMDRIAGQVLTTEEFKITQLNNWYQKTKAIYEKAGKDTTEIEKAYALEKIAIHNENIEAQKQKMQELTDLAWQKAQERLASEYQVMDAMRAGWGLTWDEIKNEAVDAWQDIGAAVTSVSQQMGNAFADVILKTKTLKEAAHDLAESILRQTINTLVKIAMQRIILSMVQKTSVASEAAAMTAMGAAIFSSMAPAAITATIATSGGAAIAGMEAYMAALASMTASSMETQALFKGMGMAYARGGKIDRPTVILAGEESPGEVIVPLAAHRRNEREAAIAMIAPYFQDGSGLPGRAGGGGAAQVVNNYYFNINAIDTKSFSEVVRNNPGAITEVTIDELRGGNEALRDTIRRTTR